MTLPEGDGLSIRVSSTYIAAHADIHRSREFYGNPVGSSSIRDNSANELLARLIADLALKPTHVPVFIDANGMTTWQNAAVPSQPDTWLASLWGYVAQIKAIGAKVAVGTVPAQFNPNSPARKDAFNCRRAVVKAAIRRAVGSKIDAVIDFASNTAIAIDAAPCDPTYFLDPVHPTGADQGRMYAIYRPGLDAMLGNPTLAPPAAVASNFDTAAQIETVGDVPPSMAPDVVGAFRFVCAAGQISNDDPIVYPGRPGAAHLHQFFGNALTDANSTYASLRATGDSTCQNKLNRSAYWIPALLNGKGHVIRPDYTQFYYKRRPASDPWCGTGAKCIGLPNGLREIFGWDQARPGIPVQAEWKCANARGTVVNNSNYGTMSEALAVCTPGVIPDAQLFVTVNTPECWNGEIDVHDHHSHTARFVKNNDTGFISCPATHPYHPPHFTFTVAYGIKPGDDVSQWRFSSDHMMPGGRQGDTFHVDTFLAWNPPTQATWTANCIDKLLSCADGQLGDGTIMKRGPLYTTFKAVPRLVAVP